MEKKGLENSHGYFSFLILYHFGASRFVFLDTYIKAHYSLIAGKNSNPMLRMG